MNAGINEVEISPVCGPLYYQASRLSLVTFHVPRKDPHQSVIDDVCRFEIYVNVRVVFRKIIKMHSYIHMQQGPLQTLTYKFALTFK